MQHIFAIQEKDLPKVKLLFSHKFDGEYFVLTQSNGFSDIAQWSDKYQNIKILTVPTDRLNRKDCID